MTATDDPSKSAKPRRRWFQFSLGTLLRLVVFVALVSAWLAVAIQHRELQLQRQLDDGFIRIAREEQERGKGQVLVGYSGITVPRHRYILVQTNAGLGAFMLTDEISTGDGGVRYRWSFRPGTKGDFTVPEAISGESSVYERYVRVPGQGNVVRDAGGQTYIECGPIKLEWSLGNHVYLPWNEPMKIAYTHESDIADVRPDDPGLIWCGCKLTSTESGQPQAPGSSDQLR